MDFQYTGKLADYSYNGITYEQSTETYAQILEDMYHDFLAEWGTLSDEERKSVKGYMELIISKRYLYDEFFFDVPSREIINDMANDNGVPRQSVEMARFVCDMAGQQKFYLTQITKFLNLYPEQEVPNIVCDTDNNIPVPELSTTLPEPIEIPDNGKTLYQELHKKYGDTMSAKQLSDFFGVDTRTITNWENRGYINNISPTNDERKSNGQKKRGEEKRYLTSAIAKNIEMQRKFNQL